VKHSPNVTREQGTRESRTVDPLHPEFGALHRLELSRDYWMDRVVGRFHPEADPGVGGSILLPANVSDEVVAHLKSPLRVEVIDRHGHPTITWAKERAQPDDWLQSTLYAEVAAVGLGLDLGHESTPQPPKDREQAIAEGDVRRSARSVGRDPVYVRGRRGRRGRGAY